MKGNNYPAAVDAAAMQKAQKASADFKKALDFVPNMGPDLLTSATIAPERLALADKAVEVAAVAPEVQLLRANLPPARWACQPVYGRYFPNCFVFSLRFPGCLTILMFTPK